MSERDSEEDDDLDDDEEEDESPPPPKAKPKASPSQAGGASKPSVSSRGKSGAPPKAPVPITASRALAIGIVALAVGGALGWFGQIQKAKAALRAEAAAAPAGSGAPSGPCGAWQSKVCSGVGEQSAACQQAKGAAELLLPSTCLVALGTLPETLAKVKAARASCDKLVSKICQDLPPGSKTCGMVKERTPSFPRERCDQMLLSYDKVITELKQMDQQGGMQMGGPHGGMPPGAMPPGGMPHITIPQGAPKP